MGNLSLVIMLLAAVVCTEGLMAQGGQLKVEQDSQAWWDESSQQWVIRLTCGSFTFVGSPPLNVTWTNPQGESRFSSGYDSNGKQFYLHLDSPLQGGNVSCSVPAAHLPLLCHDCEPKPGQSNGSGMAEVNEIRARLVLAEANQESLETLLEEMEKLHREDMNNVAQFCQGIKDTVEEHQAEIEKIQEALNKSQAADLSGPCADGAYKVLNESWRSVDNVYQDVLQCDDDLDHSWYRFYLHGQDAEIPTYCVEANRCQTHAPQWLDLQGKSMPEVGQEVRARACAHWVSDCCNWESPITVRNCGPFYVYKLEPGDPCYLAYCTIPKN